MAMTNDRTGHLHFLKSQAVNAIIFLDAYLQVEMDNATLTCYTWPLVLGAATDYTHTHIDYKNQLCHFITKTISSITETEKGLVLTFDSHELLFEKDGAREVLVITDANGEWYSYPTLDVWGFV